MSNLKIVVEILPDHDIQNPADPEWDDCNWKVISFNNHHINYEDPYTYLTLRGEKEGHFDSRYVDAIDVGLRRKLQVGTAFILSYYEHGACRWSLQGEGMQCQWDTTKVAGLLIWPHKPSELGPKTYEDRAKDARQFLKAYTDWCNGHGHGYVVKLVEVDEDGDETTLDEESCFGFYDSFDEETKHRVIGEVTALINQHGKLEVELRDNQGPSVFGLYSALKELQKEVA